MAVVMLPDTKRQTELLAKFRTGLRGLVSNFKEGIVSLAAVYRECADAGTDMSVEHFVSAETPRSLVQLVADVGTGVVLPDAAMKLFYAPPAVAIAMRKVSRAVQEGFVEKGVEVWRDGEAQRVPIDHLTEREAGLLVDPKSGLPLSAEEKIKRSVKKPKTDKELEGIWLSPEQWEYLEEKCKRRGVSVSSAVLSAMVKDGLVQPRRRARAA